MNRVHKVVYDGNNIVFIIQTDDEQDFWWWSVPFADVQEYFARANKPHTVVSIAFNKLNREQAEQFANDIDNSDKGVSCASFDTVEDALRDLGINI